MEPKDYAEEVIGPRSSIENMTGFLGKKTNPQRSKAREMLTQWQATGIPIL